MPVGPHIRKQILIVIDEQIIPLLKSAVVTQVLTEPDKPQTESPLDMLTYWQEHFVSARKIPHLGLLYSSANDER